MDCHRLACNPARLARCRWISLASESQQATQGTSKILLTQGTGKVAVNISKAATTSVFVKALNIIMEGAKMPLPW